MNDDHDIIARTDRTTGPASPTARPAITLTPASHPTSLRMIVPGFATAWEQARATGLPRLAALERFAGRGTTARVTLTDPRVHDWQLATLRALGLGVDSAHASGVLEWLGHGGEQLAGSWLRADFVHVEVGTHAARVHAVEPLGEDAGKLQAALSDHFAESGFSLKVAPGEAVANHFFLNAPDVLEVDCFVPAFDETDVRERLPQGRDGARLRRLFTEAQMLLHDHPVNAVRERRRQRSVNAVWFSGAGVFDAIHPVALPVLFGDDPWVRGLARLHAAAIHSPGADAEGLLRASGPGVAIVPVAGADPVRALQDFEMHWIAPLALALKSGRLAALHLSLDNLDIRIDPAALRRFWRRRRPLVEFS